MSKSRTQKVAREMQRQSGAKYTDCLRLAEQAAQSGWEEWDGEAARTPEEFASVARVLVERLP